VLDSDPFAPSENDRAMATGNMHKNLVKFGRAVFELSERTDRHTHHNTSHAAVQKKFIAFVGQTTLS